MSKINLLKEPDGWRATVEKSGHVIVIDGFFDDDIEAAKAALAVQKNTRI